MNNLKDAARKARAVGINHIALEVGDIDEALDFYGSFLEFEIQRRSENAAFIYFGDQFINFSKGRKQGPDDNRHFGIAVDDKELVRRALAEMGVELLDGRFLDFLDPGATGSRSRPTPTSSSARPTTSCAAWGSDTCRSRIRPSRSSGRRAWRLSLHVVANRSVLHRAPDCLVCRNRLRRHLHLQQLLPVICFCS